MKKHSLITAALLLPATLAMSAGYQLNLQGLRQLAMGGGGAATPWDASAIFYNPGALSNISGLQAYGSALFIMPKVQYAESQNGGLTARSANQTFTPFNLYVGGPIKKGSRLGLGIGVYTPFGSGLKWDDNWTGRYIIQEIELQSIFVQPTISYRINDRLSVGAGFVYAFGSVKLNRAIPAQDASGNDGQAKLKGNANGLGFNAGVHLKANDKLSFGLTYRSRVNMKVKDGDANFTVPTALASRFPNTSFTAELPLPEVFSLGVAYKPLDKLTLQLDFNLTGWKAYKELAFDYSAEVIPDTRAARNYHNRLATRLGGHYQATKMLAIMLGGAYDPSPVVDDYVSPDLPDANRIVLTGGLTVKPTKKLTILAVIEYVNSQKRNSNYVEANFSGRYQTKAITPGIGLSYDF
jgi:long-chain fatty acid transport protein